MFYSKISRIIEKSKFIREFDELSQTSGLLVHNLNRSAKSLLLARAFAKTGKNVIFVTADDKMAEEYLEDLDLLLGRDAAYFLPDYEVLPYEQRSPHYLIRAQRIETLTAAVSDKPAVFTVPVRSFLRRIPAAGIFGKNIITLKKNSELNPDKLVSDLVGMGYENQFQVTKVGELARRGGIIDVFSPNSHKPVRIEFFGDEIESIRVFSVSSQRSTGEELDRIRLIPSREFSLHDIDTSEEMWQRIHKDGFYEGIELDVSLLLSKTETFLQYFEVNNCLVFWDEFQFFSAYFREILEETIELYQKNRSKYKSRPLPRPEDIFESENFIVRVFKDYQNIFLNSSYQEFAQISNKLEAPVSAQTNMHGSLEILEQEISTKLQNGYHIFLQSDNRSQSKRMLDLLPQFENKIGFTIGVLQNGFNLQDCKLAIFTDHEIFSRYKRKRRQAHFSNEEALVDYESLKPGDYVVHIDHGIGIYSGLKKLQVGGNTIECLTLKYAENDVVYVPTFQLSLVSKFVSEEGIAPTIHKLGSKKWESTKNRAKKQIELVAEDLIKLYAERSLRRGIAFDKDNNWQIEMEESFIYEDTPDQATATKEIKEDMENDVPMERLLCGDVGFGKTEVAIRAAFKAVMSGWQVAVLVPTTLLAEQHYLVFRERLAQYPVRIAMFSRFRSAANIKKDVFRLARGEIDIAIGTLRLLSKDIKYKKLGLLIIDEEHRFGVRHKDKLRQMKSNVDTLYMSATPIPRTMYMALSKLKELSLIRTSPKARLPIRTVIVPWDEDVIKDAINREVDRGGQVFFVHNRVQTIESVTTELKKLLPNIRFGIGHGQLPERQLEAVTLDFAHHKFDVLVATTIMESGIDIPNANTIIINRADMFGLAQLYQIRGRVGRSNRRAYAYLIIPPKLQEDARKRLETLIEYESLGSGYQIAMRDMELRGAGTLLGTKQSGIINSIGFNYYNRLLTKAIENIQAEKPKDLWLQEEPHTVERLRIESDYYFPESYIESEKERLEIYRKMLEFDEPVHFADLKNELRDRFGEIPAQAQTALKYFQLRLLIKKIGLESLKMKKNNIIVEFNTANMPARSLLTKFVGEFKFPVKIDATNGFKMIFQVNIKQEKHSDFMLRTSLKMAEFLYNNCKQCV
jgi:transcription-repair coupling factor (superfamily II helicase)